MPDSESKESTSTSERNQEALRALARLLGRQAARRFLAENEMQALASPVNRFRNASRPSDHTTKAQ